jgi:hypothetical protein
MLSFNLTCPRPDSFLALLICLASLPLKAQTSSNAGPELLKEVIYAIENSDQLRFKMKSWERFGSEMHYTENDVVMQSDPLKVHMRMWEPDAGTEVLYVDGERDGLALIKPPGFPYANVKLNPHGSRMRKDQHHTIFESGFHYMGALFRFSLRDAGDQAGEYIRAEGLTEWEGIKCQKLVLDYPKYHWKRITVLRDENLYEIAKRLGISEHIVLEKNKLSSYDDINVGDQLWVPSSYALKVELLIDLNTKLPLVQHIYDDKGLYEHYEFHYLETKPSMNAKEFNSSCSCYGF